MKFAPSMVQTVYDSPLGRIVLASANARLVGVWFDGQRHQPDGTNWPLAPTEPVLQLTIGQLTEYFAGRRTAFDLPLDWSGGTPFQQQVWQALLELPCGSTTTYGALSVGLNRATAVRAVAGAIGRNPLSIIVPCHRVLSAGASLTGYAGGLARKAALLRLEGAGFKEESHA